MPLSSPGLNLLIGLMPNPKTHKGIPMFTMIKKLILATLLLTFSVSAIDFNHDTGVMTGVTDIQGGGGVSIWFKNSDQIPCTDVTFSVSNNNRIGIYGTGNEAAAGYPPQAWMY